MTAWKGIVGKSFSLVAFDDYCQGLQWTQWRPSFVVLHNTGVPDLAQRPDGFSKPNILSLEAYYRDQMHWSAGPHLFVDDKQIWVFTALTTPGVHSPSWNAVSLGVEMLGSYSVDSFTTGRGEAVGKNAAAAIASLSAVLGLDPGTIHLHKEDPLTTHKDCPGDHVIKDDFIAEVQSVLQSRHTGEHTMAFTDVSDVNFAKYTGGGDFDTWLKDALEAVGASVNANWLNGMKVLCTRESSLGPNAVNKWDSNATGPIQADGAPLNCSRGLAQCIPTTFAEYHATGTSWSIYDPVANMAAAMNYIMHRYDVAKDGSNLAENVQQADPSRSPHGY